MRTERVGLPRRCRSAGSVHPRTSARRSSTSPARRRAGSLARRSASTADRRRADPVKFQLPVTRPVTLRRMPRLVAAFALAFAALIPWWRTPQAAVSRPPPPTPRPPLVVFRGDDAAGMPAAHAALDHVLGTSIGQKARELLVSGTLAGP